MYVHFHLRHVSNKSRTHAATEGEKAEQGHETLLEVVAGGGVYDLLSWINVYDMKMSRNLVWLIKKATESSDKQRSNVLGSNFVESGVFHCNNKTLWNVTQAADKERKWKRERDRERVLVGKGGR